VGTDDGKVHFTQNGGQSWTEVTNNIKGLPSGSWIAQIKASNKRKGEALLIANDYRRFNYTPYAYRTKDYGKTWERIVDENDVQSYTLSIVEDPEESNLMFLGTDDGLYISINAGKDWTKWTQGFPTVSVKDLVIHSREHDLIIGTFGRAAWVLDDIRPLRRWASNTMNDQIVTLFEPPTSYQAAYRQPSGSRFGADALYNGENRGYGANFKYYFNPPKESSDKKESNSEVDKSETKEEMKNKGPHKDSLYLKIYDGERLIRTLKRKKPDTTGIYNWQWYLNEAGVSRPSRTIRKRRSEPGGTSVKPGTYRAEITYLDNISSTSIIVKSDPRLNISQKAIDEAYSSSKQLEKMTQAAANAVKQLVESKNTVNDLNKRMKKIDKEKYKESIKKGKDIVTKIDSIIALYIGKEDKRQGITRNPEVNVMQRIGTASWYSGSRPNGMTNTEVQLMKHAKDQLDDAIQQTNAFFNNEWNAYREEMESNTLSPFKETKTINIKE